VRRRTSGKPFQRFSPFATFAQDGIFSVSHSGVGEVAKYIAKQEEHHRKKSFNEEFKLFVERYELKWRDD